MSEFQMTEVRSDGRVRLFLIGELDLAVSDAVTQRLDALRISGETVVLDLSMLTFMDSTGIGVIVQMLRRSVSDGWDFEVDPHMCAQITKLLNLTGVDRCIANGRRDRSSR